MIYHSSRPSRTIPTSQALWGRRAQNALDRLGPAERALVANKVHALAAPAAHGGARRPDVQRVRSGRGLWILRVSERVHVLYRHCENEAIEIVDVVVRDGARRFSELY